MKGEEAGAAGEAIPKDFVTAWIAKEYGQSAAESEQQVQEGDIGSDGKVTKEEFIAYHKYASAER
jgi:hypothetical protein